MPGTWFGPHRMLLGVTIVVAVVPLLSLGVETLAGPGVLAPWPRLLLLWPPLLIGWGWVWLRLPGTAWAELATYFLVAATGLWVAGVVSPLEAVASLSCMLVVPLVGVFQRRADVAAVGTLLALGFEVAWVARFASRAFGARAFGVGYVDGVLFAAMGLLDTVVAHTLRRREDELRAAQLRAEEQERLYRLLADNSGDIISLLRADATLDYVSPACEAHLGYPAGDLLGQSILALCHPDEEPHLRSALQAAHAGAVARVSCRLRRSDGGHVWLDVVARPVADASGRAAQIQATARDVTERKVFEEQLAHQAFHDALTGLPNRALFQERVAHALAQAAGPGRAHLLAVLFVDLDDFKRVNDSLGHSAGDQLLVALAQRLAALIRPPNTVARLGGDEFAILLERVRSEAEATAVAEAIERALARPFRLDDQELHVTASTGIVAGTASQSTSEQLLRDADAAMYLAKSRGKAQHRVFERSLNIQAVDRLRMETELRAALERGELRLHYQPIVRLDDGAVTGFEALVRWLHPGRGLLLPEEFIPAAEDNGLIVPLGRWVMTEACRQIRAWQPRLPQEPPLFMSVNVSPRQLQAPGFAAEVLRILQETGADPRTLQLEVTEGVMLAEDPRLQEMLARFRDAGMRIAIDDFGVGYASLGYLQRFAVDALKIDRSFIGRLGHSPEDTAIVRSLISLARDLRLEVSGEGVETAEQRDHLRAGACLYGQGFLFGRPVPPGEAEAYLAAAAGGAIAPRKRGAAAGS
jgi:diguanylate cyclase (GGDEF)-like protein/PAS domain S-box-containing protein